MSLQERNIEIWQKLAHKLNILELNVISEGKFVEKLDALSLSLIDVNHTSNQSKIKVSEMNGLVKLSSSFELILGEAYVAQQTALTQLTSDFDHCKSFIKENEIIIKLLDNCSFESENPPQSEKVNPKQRKRISLALRSLQILFQEIHDSLTSILDIKLAAHETIRKTFDAYKDYLSQLAREGGVRNIDTRLEIALSPHLRSLLSHRFLEAQEIEELLESVRDIYSNAFLGGRKELTGRKLLLNQTSQIQQGTSLFLSPTSLSNSFNCFTTTFSTSSSSTLFSSSSLNWLFSSSSSPFLSGLCLALLLWAVSECFNNEQIGNEIWRDPIFSIFMSIGDLLLLYWMFGLSVEVWRRHNIDYLSLLDLHSTELKPLQKPETLIYHTAYLFSCVFLLFFIGFNKMKRGVFNFDPKSLSWMTFLFPFGLIFFYLYWIFYIWNQNNNNNNHTNNNATKKNKIWFHFLWKVLLAPLYPVNFQAGYIGDLLTSLVKVFIPMAFSFISLFFNLKTWIFMEENQTSLSSSSSTSSPSISIPSSASSSSDPLWSHSYFYQYQLIPFLTLLPLWLRLMQCLRRSIETGERWPHYGNALKYTSALTVISIGTFHPSVRQTSSWIMSFVFATLFQFVWDVTMDWGFLVWDSNYRSSTSSSSHSSYASQYSSSSWRLGPISLRPTRLLGSENLYLLIMILNFLMRFSWTLSFLPAPPSTSNLPTPSTAYSSSIDSSSFTTSIYSLFFNHLAPFFAAGEIVRRMVWGFFRLEYEQICVYGISHELILSSPSSSSTSLSSSQSSSSLISNVKLKRLINDNDPTLITPMKFEKMSISTSNEIQRQEQEEEEKDDEKDEEDEEIKESEEEEENENKDGGEMEGNEEEDDNNQSDTESLLFSSSPQSSPSFSSRKSSFFSSSSSSSSSPLIPQVDSSTLSRLLSLFLPFSSSSSSSFPPSSPSVSHSHRLSHSNKDTFLTFLFSSFSMPSHPKKRLRYIESIVFGLIVTLILYSASQHPE